MFVDIFKPIHYKILYLGIGKLYLRKFLQRLNFGDFTVIYSQIFREDIMMNKIKGFSRREL